MGILTLGDFRRDVERVYDGCAQLPQFLRYGPDDRSGLIGLLNGCFVIRVLAEPAALVLQWTPHQSCGCCSPQRIVIDEKADLDRFLAVMQAQAAALNTRVAPEPCELRRVAP